MSLVEQTQQRLASEEKVRQLAKLSPIEYDGVREQEAKKLQIRVQTLDQEVGKLRQNDDKKDEDTSPIFKTLEPWAVEVDGANLIMELAQSASAHMTLAKGADQTLALWVIFTHLFEIAETSPILAITSPEKRCGKTTTLSWLAELVSKPLHAANVTPPVVFRSVEKWQPTFLIDEADTFIGNSPELKGVLNSGHTRRTAYVIRTVGDDHSPQQFSTWCPKAIAMIGKLPDTLADRSINIAMRRKLSHEQIEKLRDSPDQLVILHRKCIRFAADNKQAIKAYKPQDPNSLNDRAADNWHTLFAIAATAGEASLATAYSTAVGLAELESEDPSANIKLLHDIQTAFKLKSCQRFITSELIQALCDDEEAPWVTWNRGKPISPRQLAKRMKGFGITTNQTVRAGDNRGKGYKLEDFNEAFSRYLPAVTRGQVNNDEASREYAMGDKGISVTDEEMPQARTHAGCHSVTDAQAGEERKII